MRIDVVHPSELGESEVAQWHALQRANPMFGNPFLSPEFTAGVARSAPTARVAVLSDASGIGAFFPHQRNRLGIGKAIGLGLNDCQAVIASAGAEWDVTQLMAACRLQVFEFDNLLAAQPQFVPSQHFQVPNPVMDLADGFAAFLAGVRTRAAKFAKEMAYKKRKLGRDLGPVRFSYDSQDLSELRTVLRWKSDQYERTGRTNRFAQDWITALVEGLASTRSAGFSGVVSMLYAGDRPVAGHFGLRFDGVLAGWFPAYDPELHRYSPGLLHHLELAEAAAAAGVTQLSMGRGGGSTPYKKALRSFDVMLAEGRFHRPGPASGLHWASRVPVRYARRVVTENPSLYRAADRVLVGSAKVRATVARRRPGGTP